MGVFIQYVMQYDSFIGQKAQCTMEFLKRQITEIVLLILFLFPGKANVALTMLACALRTAATTIAWLGFLA